MVCFSSKMNYLVVPKKKKKNSPVSNFATILSLQEFDD